MLLDILLEGHIDQQAVDSTISGTFDLFGGILQGLNIDVAYAGDAIVAIIGLIVLAIIIAWVLRNEGKQQGGYNG